MSEARNTSWILEFKDGVTPSIKSINDNMEDLDKTINGVGNTTDKTESKINKTLKGISKNTKFLSLGAGALLGTSIKTATGIEEQLISIQDKSGMTKEEVEGLKKSIKGLEGKRTTTSDLLGMAETYASAGLLKNEIEGITGVTEKLFRKTKDQNVTTDLLLTGKVAFNTDLTDDKSVESLGDKFVKGSELAKLEVYEMVETTKEAQAAFKGFNMSADSSVATMSLLAEAGFSGSRAGTMINSTFNDMVSKAEDGALAIGDFSLKLYDSNGKMKEMPQLLAEAEDGLSSMSEEQRNTALNAVFGANSQKLVNAFLSQGKDRYKEFEEQVKNSNGTLEKSYKNTGKSTAEIAAQQKAQFEDLKETIGVGALPLVNSIMSGITNILGVFNELSPVGQKILTGVIGFTAALYPFSNGILKVISGFKTLKKGVTGIVGFLSANPIVLGIAAIGVAVGVTAYIIYKNWDTIKEKTGSLINWLTEKKNNVINGFTSLKDNIIGTLKGLPSAVFGIGRDMVNKFSEGVKGFGSGIKDKVSNIFGVKPISKPKKHRTGKDRIPYDNYPSLLHKDEMVLNKRAANIYRNNANGKDTKVTNNNSRTTLPPININILDSNRPKETALEIKEIIDEYFNDLLPQI